MVVNAPLLEQVMQHIEDHPEQHNQMAWLEKTDCGTAACMAGWACVLSGMKGCDYEQGVLFAADGMKMGMYASHVRRNSDTVPVRLAAQDLLGLTDGDASVLFDGMNTRNQLKHMVKDLVNGENLRPRARYEL